MSEALKMCPSFDPAIRFLGIYPKVINIHTKCSNKDIHPNISYDKGKRGKQPKCPTGGEKLSKDGLFIQVSINNHVPRECFKK